MTDGYATSARLGRDNGLVVWGVLRNLDGWLMALGYTVLLITGVVEIILHDKRGGRTYAPRYASAYHRRLVFQPADSRRR